MLAIFGIISVAILIILIELPFLKQEKLSKESIVFGLFLLIGATLAILLALDMNLSSPFDWLMVVFKPLNNWVDQISLG